MDERKMAEKVACQGGRLYLVGGAVRDIALGKTPKDRDYCVTGLSQEEFVALFPEAYLRGKDFPVFDIDRTEFALARRERKIAEGHQGFAIDTDKSLTIEDDLIRRDLTMNSMAYDILDDKLIDPFGGVEDIHKKLIRATSPAFTEDPLRVYRAARFAAQYGFAIEEGTLSLMRFLKHELGLLSSERVFAEFRKALLSEQPSRFFEELRKCDCLAIHFSEIAHMIGIPQPVQYHPEGDVYHHTMEVITRCAQKTDNELIRFGALVHDFGKIVTPQEILPHHYQHEAHGDELIRAFCHRLKMPSAFRKAGLVASHEHMKAGKYDELRTAKKVDFIEKNYRTLLGLEGLEVIANCDKVRSEEIQFAKLGHEMMQNVNGKEMAREGITTDKLLMKLRQMRIQWLKNKENEKKKDSQN